MKKKDLKVNFLMRDGKIFVYPHTDSEKHSHVGLLALFLIFLILLLFSATIQVDSVPATGFIASSGDCFRPFYDIVNLILAPVT